MGRVLESQVPAPPDDFEPEIGNESVVLAVRRKEPLLLVEKVFKHR